MGKTEELVISGIIILMIALVGLAAWLEGKASNECRSSGGVWTKTGENQTIIWQQIGTMSYPQLYTHNVYECRK
jgi:hypothetical protein